MLSRSACLPQQHCLPLYKQIFSREALTDLFFQCRLTRTIVYDVINDDASSCHLSRPCFTVGSPLMTYLCPYLLATSLTNSIFMTLRHLCPGMKERMRKGSK